MYLLGRSTENAAAAAAFNLASPVCARLTEHNWSGGGGGGVGGGVGGGRRNSTLLSRMVAAFGQMEGQMLDYGIQVKSFDSPL